jgi:hypothetical protein
MDLNQGSALGAALGSLGLGLVALWSWIKMRAVLHQWDKVVCTVVRLDDATYVSDGDTVWLLRVTFHTPRGERSVTPEGYNAKDTHEADKAAYAIGSRHTLYVGPRDEDAYLSPPWSRYNPTIPAVMSLGFGALAIGIWMGWIETSP